MMRYMPKYLEPGDLQRMVALGLYSTSRVCVMLKPPMSFSLFPCARLVSVSCINLHSRDQILSLIRV